MPKLAQLALLLLSATSATLAYYAPAPASVSSQQRISPEIVNQLKDFIDLIPIATVDEIVAEHLILDGGFRSALKYLRSTQFVQLQQQLQQIPEIIEILDFLHLLVTTTTTETAKRNEITPTATCELPTPQFDLVLDNDVPFDSAQLEIVLLDADLVVTPNLHDTASAAAAGAATAHDLHSFSSFVAEVLQHLPRDNYVQMINTKRRSSTAFAEFYAALRDVQFRPMVQSAMKASNVANVIKTLSGHSIDVKSLEPIAFQVISWGPAATSSDVV